MQEREFAVVRTVSTAIASKTERSHTVLSTEATPSNSIATETRSKVNTNGQEREEEEEDEASRERERWAWSEAEEERRMGFSEIWENSWV